MTNLTCLECGTTLISGARFCRVCGQPVTAMDGSSVTEATTRILETPVADAGHAPRFTTAEATHLAASPRQPVAPVSPDSTAPKRRSMVLALTLILSGVMFVFCLLAFGVWYAVNSTTTSTVGSTVLEPPMLEPPPPPPPPPAPPILDFADGTASATLIYPKATVTQNITSEGKTALTQLTSEDDFERVVEWYEKRLKPTDKIVVPGEQAILTVNQTTVIISEADGGTSIMVTNESGG
jgi:hypothetical protein